MKSEVVIGLGLLGLGLSIPALITESWFAAGFPLAGNDWTNEYGDWHFNTSGFSRILKSYV